jgi:hypothetical protein
MNSILLILLGMFIWQSIAFIVLCLSGEDEDIVMRVGCGFPLVFYNSIMWIVKIIRRYYIRKHYTMAHIWKAGGCDDGSPSFLSNVRVKKNELNLYYKKGENSFYIEEWVPEWKTIESSENIKRVNKNGWFCQAWVQTNLVK